MKMKKEVAKVFMINGISATIIIPISIARKFDIDRPCYVIVEDTKDGILIKKANID